MILTACFWNEIHSLWMGRARAKYVWDWSTSKHILNSVIGSLSFKCLVSELPLAFCKMCVAPGPPQNQWIFFISLQETRSSKLTCQSNSSHLKTLILCSLPFIVFVHLFLISESCVVSEAVIDFPLAWINEPDFSERCSYSVHLSNSLETTVSLPERPKSFFHTWFIHWNKI